MHVLFLLLVFLMGNHQPKSHNEDHSQSRTGEVRGSVVIPPTSNRAQNRFRGRAYRNRTNDQDSDHTIESTNPLLDVVISAHPISINIDTKPLAEPVQILQKDANFAPNVTPVTVGSIVQFVNDDAFFHNVFSLTPGARFNIGRRPKGDIYSKEIPQLEWKVEGLGPINLYCDIHSQMSAVILSLDTPYFTQADENGFFSLPNLPDGEYEIKAYHPKFELLTRKVIISEGKIVELDFSFS